MKAGNKRAAQYVGAIDSFTRQSSRPTAADKPMLAKHPVAQMMYGLQSWMYSYNFSTSRRRGTSTGQRSRDRQGYTAGERATIAIAPVQSPLRWLP